MLSNRQWAEIQNFQPGDFINPAGLDFSIVKALDRFVDIVHIKPTIISDYRPYDPANPGSQHALGKAVDTVWPVRDPLWIWRAAKGSKLFGGVGLYVNEIGAVSFHFDTRPLKPSGDMAEWGGIIEREAGVKSIEYVASGAVLNLITGKALPLVVLFLAGLLLYHFSKS